MGQDSELTSDIILAKYGPNVEEHLTSEVETHLQLLEIEDTAHIGDRETMRNRYQACLKLLYIYNPSAHPSPGI